MTSILIGAVLFAVGFFASAGATALVAPPQSVKVVYCTVDDMSPQCLEARRAHAGRKLAAQGEGR